MLHLFGFGYDNYDINLIKTPISDDYPVVIPSPLVKRLPQLNYKYSSKLGCPIDISFKNEKPLFPGSTIFSYDGTLDDFIVKDNFKVTQHVENADILVSPWYRNIREVRIELYKDWKEPLLYCVISNPSKNISQQMPWEITCKSTLVYEGYALYIKNGGDLVRKFKDSAVTICSLWQILQESQKDPCRDVTLQDLLSINEYLKSDDPSLHQMVVSFIASLNFLKYRASLKYVREPLCYKSYILGPLEHRLVINILDEFDRYRQDVVPEDWNLLNDYIKVSEQSKDSFAQMYLNRFINPFTGAVNFDNS